MKVLLWDTNFAASPVSQRCHIFLQVPTDDQENLCASFRGSEQVHVVEVSKNGFSFTELALRGRESRRDGQTEKGRHREFALSPALAFCCPTLSAAPQVESPRAAELSPVSQGGAAAGPRCRKGSLSWRTRDTCPYLNPPTRRSKTCGGERD